MIDRYLDSKPYDMRLGEMDSGFVESLIGRCAYGFLANFPSTLIANCINSPKTMIRAARTLVKLRPGNSKVQVILGRPIADPEPFD